MDVELLKSSWATAKSLGGSVPQYFYAHLFWNHPELRAMFPVGMTEQRAKLMDALDRVVVSVENLEPVVPRLEQLARDHRRFGAKAEHYNAVGMSILATFKHFFGAGWTPELHQTWSEAYGLVAKVMVAAAEQEDERSPAVWEAEVTSFERRSTEVAIFTVVPRQPFSYRPGQSVPVQIPHRERTWRYLSPANAPDTSGRLEFHIQPVPGGRMSLPLVNRLRPGDVVQLGSPVGHQLTLPDDGPLPDLLMVAGGTGLAPLCAVLEQIGHRFTGKGSEPMVHLFHGARVPWNLYHHQHLRDLAFHQPWFDYTPVVSDDPTYPGERGLVGEVAAQAADWTRRVALVCGPPAMVEHTTQQLVAVGVPAESIRYEQYSYRTAAAMEATL